MVTQPDEIDEALDRALDGPLPPAREPEPEPVQETPQEAQERVERRHPATVTADRLRAQRDDLRMDLTPREQDAIAVVLAALDRIGG